MKFDSHHFAFLAVLLVSSVSIFTLLSLDNSITGNFDYGTVGVSGTCSGESGQWGEKYSCLPGLTCYRQDPGAVEGVCQGTPTQTVCGNNVKEYNELCDPAGSACTINGGQGTCSNDCKTCNPQQQTWSFLPEYQPGESVYEGVNEYSTPTSAPASTTTCNTNDVINPSGQCNRALLTIQAASLPQTTVNAGSKDVVIGKFIMTFTGQNVQYTSSQFGFLSFQFSNGITLNNVRMKINGQLHDQKPSISGGSQGFAGISILLGETKNIEITADLSGSTQPVQYTTRMGLMQDPTFMTKKTTDAERTNTLTINPGSVPVAPPSISAQGVSLPAQPIGNIVEIARFDVKALNVPAGTNKIEARDMGIRFTWPSLSQGNTIVTGLNDLAVYYDGAFMSAFSMSSVQNKLVQQTFSPAVYVYSDQTKTISVKAYPLFQGTYTTELIGLASIKPSGSVISSITIQSKPQPKIGDNWIAGDEKHEIIGPELAFDCQISNKVLTGLPAQGGNYITLSPKCEINPLNQANTWITYVDCHAVRDVLEPGTNVIKQSFYGIERVTKTCASGQKCLDPNVGCVVPPTTTGTTSGTPLASTGSTTTPSSACPGGSAVYGPDLNDGLVTAESCNTQNVGFFGSSVFVEGKGPANADGSLNTCNGNTLKKYYCGNTISGTSKSQVCSKDIPCSSLGGTCAIKQYQGSNYGVCVDSSGKEIQTSSTPPSTTTTQAVSNCKKAFQDFYARYPLRSRFTENGKWLDAPVQQPTRITFFYPGPEVTSYNNQNLKVKVFSQSNALLGEYNAEGSMQDGSKPKTLTAGVGMVTTIITSLPQSVLKFQLFTASNEECSDQVTVNIPSSLVPAQATTQTTQSTTTTQTTTSVAQQAVQQVPSLRPGMPSVASGSVPSISPQQIAPGVSSVSRAATPRISGPTSAAAPISSGVAPRLAQKSGASQKSSDKSQSPVIDVSSYAAPKTRAVSQAGQVGKIDSTSKSGYIETQQIYSKEVESGKELVLRFRGDPNENMMQIKVKSDKGITKTFYAVNKGEGVFELKITPIKVKVKK